jgi:hypothetical protein
LTENQGYAKMAAEHKGLEITDSFISLGQYVLKEEITILTPYLRDMILKFIKTADHGKDDEDKSRPIRQG